MSLYQILSYIAKYIQMIPDLVMYTDLEMGKLALLFLVGFVFTYAPLVYYYSRIEGHTADVLALDIHEELIEGENKVPSASLDEKTETTTPSPTIKPTEKPKVATTKAPVSTETPIPVPTSTPDVWSPSDIEHLFEQYAGQYGVDKNILERIANCESHFNPNSRNGDYLGMFQFSASTWQNYRMKMGLDANLDLRTNTEESIRTAAFVVQQRGVAPWPSCL